VTTDEIVAWSTWGAIAVASIGCAVDSPRSLREAAAEARSAPYPAGPYGTAVGWTVADAALYGYADPARDALRARTLALADFYNPHAVDPSYHPASAAEDDRIMAASSGYARAGMSKPTVLLVQVAAGWCGPCNREAKDILPAKHRAYAARGGEILLDLHDGVTPGVPATLQDLQRWTAKYRVDYPSAIGLYDEHDALLVADAFPVNVVIDTTTMRIAEIVAGEAVPRTCSEVTACTNDADCAFCMSGACPGGKACASNADCAAETCTPSMLWSTYEGHLDRRRPGCTLK
jgi:hypothetical protein